MDKNNQGAFFVNDKRATDQHPHYSGNANINGVDYYVNIWANQSKEGKKFWSMKFKPKVEANATQVPPPPPPPDEDNGELPF